ncbi:hypothetical protein B0T16DRAFT_420560 [Cercophora newfieldiana]|uniref:Uncharacterized protein n=1 Tax=Cercophora newfieldiana TaxID=92897 RepID=A0AA40CK25_9PEZI|nr:hypothetical protein B0T16DRAFT_420560 [Cercophora newfieldiana]
MPHPPHPFSMLPPISHLKQPPLPKRLIRLSLHHRRSAQVQRFQRGATGEGQLARRETNDGAVALVESGDGAGAVAGEIEDEGVKRGEAGEERAWNGDAEGKRGGQDGVEDVECHCE